MYFRKGFLPCITSQVHRCQGYDHLLVHKDTLFAASVLVLPGIDDFFADAAMTLVAVGTSLHIEIVVVVVVHVIDGRDITRLVEFRPQTLMACATPV